MSTQNGTDLVRAAQGGARWAQDQLVAAYLPLVYNIVGRALNGHHDVDDVVQETMLRALDGLGGLRSPESFRSWLVAIAMNRVRSHHHTQQSGLRTHGLDDAGELAHAEADFVDLTLVRLNLSGQRRETAEATRWMEPDDSALLSLWWLECAGELTRHEVAAALGLSPEHTAVRVRRMKEQLEAARVVVRALSENPLCPTLHSGLDTWDGRPSALWRKRIARHARDCAHCAGLWSGLVPAEGLLAGLLLVPPAALLLASVRERAGFAPAAASAPSPTPGYEGGGTDEFAPAPGYESGGAHERGGPAGPRAPYAARGAGRAAGPGTRSARRHQRRARRRAVVAAGIAVVAVTGGSFALITGPERDTEPADTIRAAAPGTSLPARPEPTRPEPTTASPSATPSPSTPPSPVKSPSATAGRSAKPSPPKAPATRTASPAPRPKSADTTAESAADPTAQQVIDLANSERAQAGCGPLTANPLLDEAARRHSEDMAARDFFDHTNPDGDGPGERVTAAGYRWTTYGENIAKGQRTPAQVMESWMNSPGHRANILNCSFEEIGIGLHDSGGPYWTQVFGAR
ncbi:sigma-70 family RNA polymerase sigma factor [Streptomyces sp. NPDC093600]|uniref:sigma-70 family RNA polymerase sigma factor n=1 Tax=Streptomyces sp. NPDC093600 TaxID=3366047 RepID=UPI0038224B5F